MLPGPPRGGVSTSPPTHMYRHTEAGRWGREGITKWTSHAGPGAEDQEGLPGSGCHGLLLWDSLCNMLWVQQDCLGEPLVGRCWQYLWHWRAMLCYFWLVPQDSDPQDLRPHWGEVVCRSGEEQRRRADWTGGDLGDVASQGLESKGCVFLFNSAS